MSVIGINGSPRSNWNTAKLVMKALEGAASNGFKTEMINLGQIDFKPCTSCFACKKPNQQGKCHYNDAIIPVFDKVLNADAVIFGSPTYWGTASALFQGFLERLLFSQFSYDDLSFYQPKKKIKTGLIFNCGADEKEGHIFEQDWKKFQGFIGGFFGSCELLKVYDTMEVDDYSKFLMKSYDKQHKEKVKREQFPLELQKAFELGKRITSK